MRKCALILFSLIFCGQLAFAKDARTAVDSVAPALTDQSVTHAPLSQQTSKELPEVLARLTGIDKTLSELKDKLSDPLDRLLQILFSFVGVLVGAALSVWSLNKNLAHQVGLADIKGEQERQLAEKRAAIDIGNSFAQWQLKQLSELYGPLRALLLQSNALYRHMNKVLVAMDPTKFRLRPTTADEDFDCQIFEVLDHGAWTRFRTVTHLDESYGRGYGIEDYFDEIVKIGERMTKVITEQAGYARPGSDELLSMFGKYLAHYSVLSRLHEQAKARLAHTCATVTNQIVVDESAAFPNKMHNLIDADFEAINKELSEWRERFRGSSSVTPSRSV